jgi:hypothetical protein
MVSRDARSASCCFASLPSGDDHLQGPHDAHHHKQIQ